MPSNILNIQSDDFAIFANRVDKISKHDLPLAVRGTLNQVAVNMKGGRGAMTQKGLIQESGERSFDHKRRPNVFKFMSGFTKAKTLEINSMQSVAGIINRSGKDKLAEGLGEHEKSTTFKQKATPYRSARKGSAKGNRILRRLYIEKLLSDAIDLRGRKGQQYNRMAMFAYNEGRPVIWGKKSGDSVVGLIDWATDTENSIQYDTTPLYRLNDSGTIRAKKQDNYITKAAIIAMKNVDRIFKQQAQRRIDKTFKK